jgi:ABC-2 family transporter protein
MYARLWWKDARQFWPIWVLLVVCAAAIQWMMLFFIGDPARNGVFGALALLWAGLYGLAAGAAAFAGERETGTLRLLEILSIDRRVVWAGKTSFAVVSTLILTAALLVIAAFGTERSDLLTRYTSRSVISAIISVVLFVLVALGWGLFWSSILKSALVAALAAMGCTGLMLGYFVRNLHLIDAASFAVALLAVVVATIAASHVFFTRSVPLRRFPLLFRSPIVFTESPSPRARRMQVRSPSAVIPMPPSRENAAMRHSQASPATRVGRRSWMLETRNLVWQTIKEGRTIWLMVLAVALALPASNVSLGGEVLAQMEVPILIFLLVIATAVSAFGLENRARTQRFLVHHGARPGSVWLVKVLTWLVGLVAIAITFGCLFVLVRILAPPGAFSRPSRGEDWGLVAACVPLAYAVALICGMAFRRGVTAFVVAAMLTFGLVLPSIGLVQEKMLAATGIPVAALAVLAVSWLWRTDWFMERPAPGRWLRLGFSIAAASVTLFACYVGSRVWSVPDIGPIAAPEAWARTSSIVASPESNAADLYREAARVLRDSSDSGQFLSRNTSALELIQRAAARPDCRFNRSDRPTLLDEQHPLPWVPFVRLVALEEDRRLSEGDLAGSWEDIVVLFRMSTHFLEESGVDRATPLLTIAEREALIAAMDWALAPGQTSERLHAALVAYRSLPAMPAPRDVVRAQSNLFENTLDLPVNALREYLGTLLYGQRVATLRAGGIPELGMINLVTTPWELARARRVNRAVSAAALESAGREPGHRLEHYWHSRELFYEDELLPDPLNRISRPAQDYLAADVQNEVARRALVQVFAIRAWQLKHNGEFPERLEMLVPDELPSLPIDPYSDRPFGYVRSTGKVILPPQSALAAVPVRSDSTRFSPVKGSWLLYSVGRDRTDDLGTAISDEMNFRLFRGYDIVFGIPPLTFVPSEPAKPE